MDGTDLSELVSVRRQSVIFTYVACHLGQQTLAVSCASCVVPAHVRILDELQFLHGLVPMRLRQHAAQSVKIVGRRQTVQVEIEEVAAKEVLRSWPGPRRRVKMHRKFRIQGRDGQRKEGKSASS